jgi:hypothetical protein
MDHTKWNDLKEVFAIKAEGGTQQVTDIPQTPHATSAG